MSHSEMHSGNGGARGRVIIGRDGPFEGKIGKIIIDYEGYGYRNNFGEVKTVYGTIGGDSNTDSANSDNKTVTGQIDEVNVVTQDLVTIIQIQLLSMMVMMVALNSLLLSSVVELLVLK